MVVTKTKRPWRTALWSMFFVAAGAGCAVSPARSQTPSASVAIPATAARQGSARQQVHRTWAFPADGVVFSNRLACARLNGVKRLGANRYEVTIAPESLPINPSPWYGFSIEASKPRTVSIAFHYEHGRQRYWPKLSTDGTDWHAAAAGAFVKAADGRYTLTIEVGTQPLRVFAQTPVCLRDFRQWESRLEPVPGMRMRTIGHSVQGRPLRMLSFGNRQARQMVLVIGRQHPPEVTGSKALMPFVDRLAADTPLARRFRAHTLVLVVPLINLDGVVEGNWRGNMDGKDLNRDWGTFTEPETRAVRDMLVRQIDRAGRHLAFAIDFHSTWSDVFYTVKQAPSRAPGGVLRRWIDAMQARFPGRIREKANDANSTVFKNWAFKRYHAPTVTYEVGDRTSDAKIGRLADFAADAMMRILTDPPRH